MEKTDHISKFNPRPKLPPPWGRRYIVKQCYARYLGQEWAFTHESWYQMWEASGVMHLYGRTMQGYRMVRLDPIEAWGPHNCKIVSTSRFLDRNIRYMAGMTR